MSIERIIRVHTASEFGVTTVYARIMEPFSFDGVTPTSLDGSGNITYSFIEGIEFPAALQPNQAEVVDYFRRLGWTVEQDHGYYEWGP